MTGPIDRRTPYDELPEYLSPEQYQHYLGISRTTVYDLLRRQAIPHLVVGRLKRIPKSALCVAPGPGVE
jgi:excisionase family DNA binding protein